MEREELLLLGEIKGIVQGLKEGQDMQNGRFDKIDARIGEMDKRMRHLEQRAAVTGAVSGGAMAVGTALIIEGLKHWLNRGGQ